MGGWYIDGSRLVTNGHSPSHLLSLSSLPITVVLACFVTSFWSLCLLFFWQEQATGLQAIKTNWTVEIWPETSAQSESETKRAVAFLAAQADVLTYNVATAQEVKDLLGADQQVAIEGDVPILITVQIKESAIDSPAELEKSLAATFPSGKIWQSDVSKDEQILMRNLTYWSTGLVLLVGSFLIVLSILCNHAANTNIKTLSLLRLFGSRRPFLCRFLFRKFLPIVGYACLACMIGLTASYFLCASSTLGLNFFGTATMATLTIPLFYLSFCFLFLFLRFLSVLRHSA